MFFLNAGSLIHMKSKREVRVLVWSINSSSNTTDNNLNRAMQHSCDLVQSIKLDNIFLWAFIFLVGTFHSILLGAFGKYPRPEYSFFSMLIQFQ